MVCNKIEDAETPFMRQVTELFDYIPAVNIKHSVERMNGFSSLVFGYSVVGILFQSDGGYNINAFLGKAILSVSYKLDGVRAQIPCT